MYLSPRHSCRLLERLRPPDPYSQGYLSICVGALSKSLFLMVREQATSWWSCAVCLQHQFVAKDTEDARCDTTAMPRPLISWYFGADSSNCTRANSALSVGHPHAVQHMLLTFAYGWHCPCSWDRTAGKIKRWSPAQIHQVFRYWTPTEINASQGCKHCLEGDFTDVRK